MNCKKCNQELPEQATVCPDCGEPVEQIREETAETAEVVEETAEITESVEETAEETAENEEKVEENSEGSSENEDTLEETAEQKAKKKPWVWVAMILGGIVLLGALVLAVLYGLGVDLKPKQNDIYFKDTYTVSDEEAVEKADEVVATMGGKTLSNGELQLYYQNLIYNFYSTYSYYLGYMGLDLSLPLDEQVCGWAEEEQTWEQYFLAGAIENWKTYTAMELMAEETGFVLPDAVKTELEGIPANMEQTAVAAGYANAEEYIQANTGINVSLDTYLHFNDVYVLSNEYLASIYEEKAPSVEQIEAYYAENEATFQENSVTKDLGLNASVRHILVPVEGGTTDESGAVVYSNEEWSAALTEAERILAEWKAGEATEESFAELANTYSTDPGSNTTGGLYENINVDASFVDNFKNWAIDTTRVPGDTGIVESNYGYHIMYFVEGEEYWQAIAGEQYVADLIQQMLLTAQESHPISVKYKRICLAETNFM